MKIPSICSNNGFCILCYDKVVDLKIKKCHLPQK